jgi:hypothetical protein
LLIFRDHALNLEQEIIFRRAANRMVQKNDLRARPLKLLDKKDLMRIAPGKPVRGVDIDSRDDPSGPPRPATFQAPDEAESFRCTLHPQRRGLA